MMNYIYFVFKSLQESCSRELICKADFEFVGSCAIKKSSVHELGVQLPYVVTN